MKENKKYKRSMGSIECIKSHNYAKRIAGVIKKMNMYEVDVRQDINKEWLVTFYLKDNWVAKKAFETYMRYEESGGKANSITLAEHRFLGKCFGFYKDEIDWFLEEMKEELESSE